MEVMCQTHISSISSIKCLMFSISSIKCLSCPHISKTNKIKQILFVSRETTHTASHFWTLWREVSLTVWSTSFHLGFRVHYNTTVSMSQDMVICFLDRYKQGLNEKYKKLMNKWMDIWIRWEKKNKPNAYGSLLKCFVFVKKTNILI